MELTRSEVTLSRSLKRLPIRFFKKSLPLLPICLLILVGWSFWRMLSDINEKVALLTSSSVYQKSQRTTIVGNDGNFSFSDSDYTAHEHELQIHRTKLLTTAMCPPNSLPLLILVSTNVGNFDRRQLIRKTWGADYSIDTKWKTVFLLGKNNNDNEMKNVSKESRIYGDIVQGDYQENFWNMSYKVAMGFEWAVKYCTFHYLLKADDDVFVNTFGLMDFLAEYTTPTRKLYTGNNMDGSVVLREGRYAVSPEEYNETVYKPYCSGGGYILSRDVVETFLSDFDVLKPLKIDDAYIGILAERAGINVTHNEEFRMYEDNCEYRESTLVQHPARGDCLIKLYHAMIGYVSKLHRNSWMNPSNDLFIKLAETKQYQNSFDVH